MNYPLIILFSIYGVSLLVNVITITKSYHAYKDSEKLLKDGIYNYKRSSLTAMIESEYKFKQVLRGFIIQTGMLVLQFGLLWAAGVFKLL